MRNRKADSAASIQLHRVGERGFLSSLLPKINRLTPSRFLVPPGDDAAVLRGSNRLVLSIDGLTEGTHFRSSWEKQFTHRYGFSFGRALGWKLLGSALSDLAAMGEIKNRWAMIYLGAPGHLRLNFLHDLNEGISDVAKSEECALAGGDTVKSDKLTLVAAVGGELVGSRCLTRSGARPNDLVCVAGPVGDAAMGLTVLDGKIKMPDRSRRFFVKRFFNHAPLFYESRILAREKSVTSAIDLSDSLAESVDILCASSGVGADVEVSHVPLSVHARILELNPRSLLSGGEDYALLFTVNKQAVNRLKKKLSFSVIGQIRPKKHGLIFRDHGKKIQNIPFFNHYK